MSKEGNQLIRRGAYLTPTDSDSSISSTSSTSNSPQILESYSEDMPKASSEDNETLSLQTAKISSSFNVSETESIHKNDNLEESELMAQVSERNYGSAVPRSLSYDDILRISNKDEIVQRDAESLKTDDMKVELEKRGIMHIFSNIRRTQSLNYLNNKGKRKLLNRFERFRDVNRSKLCSGRQVIGGQFKAPDSKSLYSLAMPVTKITIEMFQEALRTVDPIIIDEENKFDIFDKALGIDRSDEKPEHENRSNITSNTSSEYIDEYKAAMLAALLHMKLAILVKEFMDSRKQIEKLSTKDIAVESSDVTIDKFQKALGTDNIPPLTCQDFDVFNRALGIGSDTEIYSRSTVAGPSTSRVNMDETHLDLSKKSIGKKLANAIITGTKLTLEAFKESLNVDNVVQDDDMYDFTIFDKALERNQSESAQQPVLPEEKSIPESASQASRNSDSCCFQEVSKNASDGPPNRSYQETRTETLLIRTRNMSVSDNNQMSKSLNAPYASKSRSISCSEIQHIPEDMKEDSPQRSKSLGSLQGKERRRHSTSSQNSVTHEEKSEINRLKVIGSKFKLKSPIFIQFDSDPNSGETSPSEGMEKDESSELRGIDSSDNSKSEISESIENPLATIFKKTSYKESESYIHKETSIKFKSKNDSSEIPVAQAERNAATIGTSISPIKEKCESTAAKEQEHSSKSQTSALSRNVPKKARPTTIIPGNKANSSKAKSQVEKSFVESQMKKKPKIVPGIQATSSTAKSPVKSSVDSPIKKKPKTIPEIQATSSKAKSPVKSSVDSPIKKKPKTVPENQATSSKAKSPVKSSVDSPIKKKPKTVIPENQATSLKAKSPVKSSVDSPIKKKPKTLIPENQSTSSKAKSPVKSSVDSPIKKKPKTVIPENQATASKAKSPIKSSVDSPIKKKPKTVIPENQANSSKAKPPVKSSVSSQIKKKPMTLTPESQASTSKLSVDKSSKKCPNKLKPQKVTPGKQASVTKSQSQVTKYSKQFPYKSRMDLKGSTTPCSEDSEIIQITRKKKHVSKLSSSEDSQDFIPTGEIAVKDSDISKNARAKIKLVIKRSSTIRPCQSDSGKGLKTSGSAADVSESITDSSECVDKSLEYVTDDPSSPEKSLEIVDNPESENKSTEIKTDTSESEKLSLEKEEQEESDDISP